MRPSPSSVRRASRVGMRLTFSLLANAHWLSFSSGLNVPSRIAVRIFSVTSCCTVLYGIVRSKFDFIWYAVYILRKCMRNTSWLPRALWNQEREVFCIHIFRASAGDLAAFRICCQEKSAISGGLLEEMVLVLRGLNSRLAQRCALRHVRSGRVRQLNSTRSAALDVSYCLNSINKL